MTARALRMRRMRARILPPTRMRIRWREDAPNESADPPANEDADPVEAEAPVADEAGDEEQPGDAGDAPDVEMGEDPAVGDQDGAANASQGSKGGDHFEDQ